jgi:lipopolysaccharide export system protein LptA
VLDLARSRRHKGGRFFTFCFQMPLSFFSVSARGFLLLAALCAGGRFADVFAAEGARVGTAKKVVFSEFDDKGGVLQMELHAAEASPQKNAAADSGELSVWNLTAVELRLFSKDAKGRAEHFATITSPDCRYSKPEHTASSSRELSMDSKDFAVTGGAWTWRRANDKDVVSLQKPVRATLKPVSDRGRVDVFSDALDITRHKAGADAGRAILTFSGNVRMSMETAKHGEIMLFCDTLVARLKNTGDLPGAKGAVPAAVGPRKTAPFSGIFSTGAGPARTKKETVENLDDALEGITAAGHVEILNEGREMTGARAEYNQAKRTFSTTGGARFYDTHFHVSATGEQLRYHVVEDKVEMFSAPPAAGVPPRPVALELPSFTHKEGRARRGDGIAHITGERLSINRSNGKNLVEMTGGVRGRDENLEFTSRRVFVETPRDTKPSVLEERKTARVNHLKAEGDVRANYDGRFLACESLLFRPGAQTVELSGNPSLATQGARLSGHAIFFDDARDIARVTSAPETAAAAAPRRRAEVSLPPLGKGKTRAAPRETLVSADSLVMAEKADGKAELDFSGNVILKGEDLDGRCDRLVILADMPRGERDPAPGARPKTADMAAVARIQEMTATGGVSFATSEWRAEGGEAVMHPKVALRENSPLDDNGLDGNEPKLLVLRQHLSTPGKRPRLTIYAPETLDGPAAPPPAAAVGGRRPAPVPRRRVPYHIDGDSLEIIGGSMRSRFFMRGDIRLSNETRTVSGRCDEIEGEIVREEAPRAVRAGANTAVPRYEFTRIIGRRDVHVAARGREVFGQKFELFPEAQKIRISGAPSMTDAKDGMSASPGQQGVIIYNRRTGEWEMEKGAAAEGDEERVPRPSVRIPIKGEWKKLLP